MRIRTLTRVPSYAQDVAPEVKLTFLRDVLDASGESAELVQLLTVSIPLFVNKDASNSAPE